IRFEKGSNDSSHTCSAISARPTTRPALRARYSSSAYSLAVSVTLRPALETLCAAVSRTRSATAILAGRSSPERRSNARRRASNSRNSNRSEERRVGKEGWFLRRRKLWRKKRVDVNLSVLLESRLV